jgi:hypothetical protein
MVYFYPFEIPEEIPIKQTVRLILQLIGQAFS